MTGDALSLNLAARPDLAWIATTPADGPLARTSGDPLQPLVQVRTARDQWVACHGRRDPLRDATRLADAAIAAGKPGPVVVVGGGAGYLAQALLARPDVSHVLVVEPHAACARAMLARHDWRDAFATERLTVLVGPAYEGASGAWPALRGASAPVTIEDAVLAREQAPVLERAREVLTRIAFDAAANAEARATLGATYALNTLRNLPSLLRSVPVTAIAGRGAGWPAVVAGAGPSLWSNLEGARRWRDKVVLIAVDTAVKPLLARGVEPDYIVAVDPTSANMRHLAGVGDLRHAWLVAEQSLDPVAMDACGARRVAFRLADNPPWPWLRAHGFDPGHLAVWGSVLTAAYSLACHLGCDSVHMLGADLAYTDDRPYTRGVAFEVDWARQRLLGTPLRRFWARQRAKRAIVEVPDVHGGLTRSAPHLLAFRDWLVERAATGGPRLVNTTGAGTLWGAAITQAGTASLDDLPARGQPFAPAPVVAAAIEVARRDALRAALATDADARLALVASASELAPAAAVDRALREVGAVLATDPAIPADAIVPPPNPQLLARALAHLDERVVNWCSARSGVRPARGSAPQVVGPSADDGMTCTAVDALLTHLLAQPALVRDGAPVDPPLPPRVPHEIRALLDLPWWPGAHADVIALLGLATDRMTSDGVLPRRWETPPPASTGPMDTRRTGRERRATAAATTLAAATRASCGSKADAIVLAVLDRIASGAAQGPVRLSIRATAGARRRRLATSMGVTPFFTAIAGAVFAALPNPAVRSVETRWCAPQMDLRFSAELRSSARRPLPCDFATLVAVLEPRWLDDPALRNCPMGATLGDARGCLLTPREATASIALDASLGLTPSRPWDMPLAGECHGRVWHVAWSQTRGGRLAARRADGSGLVEGELRGVPLTVAFRDDDVILVTTTEGLWRWTPGTSPRLLAPLPPAVIVEVDGDAVVLDPIPLVDGRYVSSPREEGWVVDATGVAHIRPLGAAAQAWGRDQVADVVATAYPDTHLISLSTSARTVWMAWPAPRGLAWMNDSLVVWGADGRVATVAGARTAATGAPPA